MQCAGNGVSERMTTIELNETWFGTGRWDMERRALPRKAKQDYISTLEHLARTARSCRNNQPDASEEVYLFITDSNPELDELSLILVD